MSSPPLPPSDYLKFSSDYSHSVVGGTGSARGMRSASELRDLMDTLQRKKVALENSLRANGSANPSYFSVTQVRPPPRPHPTYHLHQMLCEECDRTKKTSLWLRQ